MPSIGGIPSQMSVTHCAEMSFVAPITYCQRGDKCCQLVCCGTQGYHFVGCLPTSESSHGRVPFRSKALILCYFRLHVMAPKCVNCSHVHHKAASVAPKEAFMDIVRLHSVCFSFCMLPLSLFRSTMHQDAHAPPLIPYQARLGIGHLQDPTFFFLNRRAQQGLCTCSAE